MTDSHKTSKPNIRKRGDSYTWFAYITDRQGKRKQISRGGFRTIADAEQNRIEKLNELGHTNYVIPDDMTVADYLTGEWLPARRNDLEESTWASYEQKLRLHVIPQIGHIPLQELAATHLNRLYAQLLDTHKLDPATSRKHPPETIHRMLYLKADGYSAAQIADTLRDEGHHSAANLSRHAIAAIIRRQTNNRRDIPDAQPELSARTVGMVHGILSKALADALRWDYVYRNVAKHATAPKQKRLNETVRDTWSADQLHRFFTWLGDNRYRCPWAFLATSGARRGEVLGLKWSDLNLTQATAAMYSQLTIDTDHNVVHKARHKTGSGHTIHLDPGTVTMLTEWQQQQNQEKHELDTAYEDDGYVFCLEHGRPYHPERFSREFLRKQQQYNTAHVEEPLPRLSIHGLRHTWATLALENRIPLRVVSDRLNHSTTHITADVYSHVRAPLAKEAADLVGGLILPSGNDSIRRRD